MKKPKVLNTAFNSYSLIKTIGEGGSGIVYTARTDDESNVAIKILDSSKATKEKLKRFKNEYLFSSKNSHPNIISVIDYGLTEDGSPFFVMPLFQSSLRPLIGKAKPQESFSIFGKILNGIEAAHKLGVTHRDLKPENILINLNNENIVIADFGIAEFEEDDIYTLVETKDSTRLANFQYAAPEQRQRGKKVDKRSDIYSLGLILNELFTSELAHGTNYKSIESVDANFSYLDSIVEKMLQQNPTARYQEIEDIKKEIIAKGNQQLKLQKLNLLKTEVIPTSEIDDPLINDPVRILSAEVKNNNLIITLNHAVNPNWIWSLQNMGNYSSVYGKGPEVFQFRGNIATISTRDDEQQILDHFKSWLPNVHRRYESKVRQIQEDEERRMLEELRRKVVEAEKEAKINKSLKF